MRSIRLLALITIVSCCIDVAHTRCALAVEAPERRDAAAGFGAPGTLVLVGSVLTGSNQRLSTYGVRTFTVEAGAQVFLASRWSIGVAGFESWSAVLASGAQQVTTQYGLEARLGGLLPFSPWTSLWPQVGIGFVGSGSVLQYYIPDWEQRLHPTGREFKFSGAGYPSL